MKKAILTFGLFSMMLVLTSFTTPNDFNSIPNNFTAQHSIVLPTQVLIKLDIEPGTVSPTIQSKKLDFEPGTVSPTVPSKKLD